MQGNHYNPWHHNGSGSSGGSGDGSSGFKHPAPPGQPINPNFNHQIPNIFHPLQNSPGFGLPNPNFMIPNCGPNPQNLNFPFIPQHNLNFPAGNPIFALQQLANSSLHTNVVSHQQPRFPGRSFSQPNGEAVLDNNSSKPKRVIDSEKEWSNLKREEVLERIDSAVEKARMALVSSGESVSAQKVSRSALKALQVDSWRSLGVQMQEVPSLRSLMTLEGKINAFIHCFVGVWRVTTLYDLEVGICQTEGIDNFEDLELGPLLRHPLVLLYFPSDNDATTIFKITSEEIILLLDDFIENRGKNVIKIEEFLDFVAKKKSVAYKEKLGIRIQNLGMYVSFIWEARTREGELIQKFLNKLQQKYHYPSLHKQTTYEHLSTVSERVGSFPLLHKEFQGKHIRFNSSSSDDEKCEEFTYEDGHSDDDVGMQGKFSSKSINSSDHASSCPYPSATEEINRLGLKSEMTDPSLPGSGSSKRDGSILSSRIKRKSEIVGSADSKPSKFLKKDPMKEVSEVKNVDTKEVIDLDEADMFISIWKDACKELSIVEVFEKMLQFYMSVDGALPDRKKKRMTKMLLSHPFAGFVNVAVKSMKCGMWDNIDDRFQGISQDDITEAGSKDQLLDVRLSKKHAATVSKKIIPSKPSTTLEEILKRISSYFEQDHELQAEKNISIFRKLGKCENWLAEQLGVKNFMSLGFGDFSTFLEKHTSLLPTKVQKFMGSELSKEFPLEVCMLDNILIELVSQASNSSPVPNLSMLNKVITKQTLSTLLLRQFSSLNFKIVENGSMQKFVEIISKSKNYINSRGVIFSATLFGTIDSLAHVNDSMSKTSKSETVRGQETRTLGSVTSSDAIKILRKAPLFSDLRSWSQWDLRFAPSLGPLVGWLLNEGSLKELLCVVTKDGKVIRIDPSSTVDSFLEAALRGSAYDTALQLLSVLTLSGGEKHVPLSLLQCYAKRAFEVILHNDLQEMELRDSRKSYICSKDVYRSEMLNEVASDDLPVEVCKSSTQINKALAFGSKFFLDCLGHLPAEFQTFAAGILISGLKSVAKDVPAAILDECNQPGHRAILHEVGFSLGIVEWANVYNEFGSSSSTDLIMSSGASSCKRSVPVISSGSSYVPKKLRKVPCSEGTILPPAESHLGQELPEDGLISNKAVKLSGVQHDPALVIESIRRDEFGLESDLSNAESSMLKKQHARLGRALQCLSQELYSQDSHFVLELIQNADDNIYPPKAEPTLSFILQKSGIIVLNNEQGFSADNIKALCDVGKSTKKGSSGYIGKKGIGFKSVFRVSDAPEIHSNGYHVKFDISDGQIGFVLPTVVAPCDIDLYSRLLSNNGVNLKTKRWNTCIKLPFRSILLQGVSVNNIEAMFSDLHPSLLLFLHRLKCIVYRNMLEDSVVVMRKETVGENIVKVSCGKNTMNWFVASHKLQDNIIRQDVQTTEIAIAFTLHESDDLKYKTQLSQQPVFAFLPLRTYGLKFILQGDFVLTSSREEVDGDSPWNQWLLSEFPGLFVGAEQSFCYLPCFKENLGKAVGAFMSFVPLVGEVHGFFSCLPRIIISKLRMSNCLLLEGDNKEWVLPCKVLRGWSEKAWALLSDGLLHRHLGLGFLDKNIVLTDTLSRELGIENYGPKILVQVLSSLSCKENGLDSMGMYWLSSVLIELYTLSFNSSGHSTLHLAMENDIVDNLRKIPIIPLSDGSYSSVDEGTIWLHSDGIGVDGGHKFESFPKLYAKLRTVNPSLLSVLASDGSSPDVTAVVNLHKMLYRVGVQRLSAHEIIKVHILPAVCDGSSFDRDNSLMIDYISFVMIHLQFDCPACNSEREYIISELKSKAFILTNYGFKRLTEVSIHFGESFGNQINVNKLICNLGMKWHEVDTAYLKHPANASHANGLQKWREFFLEIGVTDFVQVVQVDKNLADLSSAILKDITANPNSITLGLFARDWESGELVHLLSLLSTSDDQESSKYLLQVLDTLWDDYLHDKTALCFNITAGGDRRSFKSSFIYNLCDIQWVASSIDDKLHSSINLFYDCDEVRSILGTNAPYAVPKIKSDKLLHDIGFKTKVTVDDVFEIMEVWRKSATPFKASISQMTRLYKFIWNEMATSKQKIVEKFHSAPCIFVPCEASSGHEDVISGVFLSVGEVCWKDSTGSVYQIKEIHSECSSISEPLCSKTLCFVYPGLHNFFVDECGVLEIPSFCGYLHILRQLSRDLMPSCAAKTVFQIFLKWADDMKAGSCLEDIFHLKESLKELEFTVLPSEQDKWVSLHSSFGLVCWCDDECLKNRFRHKDNIEFINFGELNDEEREMLTTKVSLLMRSLGIPAISEVVTREAKYKGQLDNSLKVLLVNWSLPYAQRYIYCKHSDKYFKLKLSGFEKLHGLQIVVAEKLYYRNVIKRFGIVSKKRYECNCLLQDNVLYTTLEVDTHSLFMELSRHYFDGIPDLHLANFLHMITTMAESGFTQEQTEAFILNSQKVEELPIGESVWSLESVSSLTDNESSALINEQSTQTAPKSKGEESTPSWPPVNWKDAPDFEFARNNGFRTQPAASQPNSGSRKEKEDCSVGLNEHIHTAVPINMDASFVTGDRWNPTSDGSRFGFASGPSAVNSNHAVGVPEYSSSEFNERDQIYTGAPSTMQAMQTGRVGEEIAFKYFKEQYPTRVVRWINEGNETGLPFDIVIGEKEDAQYIEVKATISGRKDWFNISVREWQFAFEKGEAYSVAHVLLGNQKAMLTLHNNPVKLCGEGKLKLVVMMPRQQKEFSIVS